MLVLVVLSVLLNLLVIAGGILVLYKKGGILFLRSKVSSKSRYSYYSDRKTFFENTETENVDIVFLGDSMIDNGEWSELFPQCKVVDRGIGGDTTSGVLNRLSSLKKLNTKKLFLLIGINDIKQNVDENKLIENYEQIISQMKNIVPNTEIFIGSILYVNPKIFEFYYYRNGIEINNTVKSVNSKLRTIAKKENVTYLEINNFLSDNEIMTEKYSLDGLHLNAFGYLKLANELNRNL